MFNFMASPVALLRFVASYAAYGMYYAFAGILTSGRCADYLALPDDRKGQTSLNRGPIRQLIVFLFSQNDPLRVSWVVKRCSCDRFFGACYLYV